MLGKEEAMSILLVEDEEQIRKLLYDFLNSRGYTIHIATNGIDGFSKFQELQPDLVLLDVMMPGQDGFTVLKKIREQSQVPVVMITARVDVEDRIRGLNDGADDYVCKPFSFKELESRIRANLRYKRQAASSEHAETDKILKTGSLILNFAYHSCHYQGQEVGLTAMQYDILALLIEGEGRVLSREQIGDALSLNGVYEGFYRTIDAHIKNLRKALGKAGANPDIIETVRGVGYRLAEQNAV